MSKRDITGFINPLKRIKNELDAPISTEFLTSKGFSEAIRYFSKRDNQLELIQFMSICKTPLSTTQQT